MASIDAFLASVLCYYVCPGTLMGLLFITFLINFHSLKQMSFAWLMNCTKFGELHSIKEVKDYLFSDLHQMKSCDPELQNKGLIRILEIGCSSGSNLNYFPKNCHLIIVEPNPYSKYYFAKNRQLSSLKLEHYLDGFAEEMFLIPDSSIDAVVSTGVLCSVKNVPAVLQEIKRVLIPGGKFFYSEHTCHQIGSWKYKVQCLINPIWKFVFNGCSLTIDLSSFIKESQFSFVKQHKIYRPWGKMLGIFLHPLLIGIATK